MAAHIVIADSPHWLTPLDIVLLLTRVRQARAKRPWPLFTLNQLLEQSVNGWVLADLASQPGKM